MGMAFALVASYGCAPATHPLSIITKAPAPGAVSTCLPGERGFLRASLRGAIDAELDWRGAGLECEGGARPGARGLRVSFLGPPDTRGRKLRIVFGIAALPGKNARGSATNVTVIIEGQHQLFATQGDDKCLVESVAQEPVPPPASPASSSLHTYRVAARGYCIDPAATLDGSGRLYINRFDFAGVARFEGDELKLR